MLTRNTQYLILVTHGENGNEQFVHGQVSRVQVTQDGTTFPAPPLDFEHAELGNLLAGFNADLLVQKQALQTQLETERAEHAATVDALQARIQSLTAIVPFDQRKITVQAFLERLDKRELLMLSDIDPGIVQIADMFKQWAANDWPIEMDSPEFQGAMQYLEQAGKLTPERIASLTVNSTREESPKQ